MASPYAVAAAVAVARAATPAPAALGSASAQPQAQQQPQAAQQQQQPQQPQQQAQPQEQQQAGGRRLQGEAQCTQYLREMRFLQTAALLVTPPSLTLPNKTRWHYSVDPCGNAWSVVSTPVDEATWHEDTLQGGDLLWCYNWTAVFAPPRTAATISVRSAADPFVVAGLYTGCSLEMPPTQRSLFEQGLGLLLPGLVVSTVAYFFLAGVCDFPFGGGAAQQQRAPLLQHGAPQPYGAAAGVEMASSGVRTGAL